MAKSAAGPIAGVAGLGILGILLLPTLPIWMAICAVGWAVSVVAISVAAMAKAVTR